MSFSRGALHLEGDPCPGRVLVSRAGDPLNTRDPRPVELHGKTQVQRAVQNSWLPGPPSPRGGGGGEGVESALPRVMFCFFSVSSVHLLAHCT